MQGLILRSGVISSFLSLNLIILSSIWSTLFPMLSNIFFTSFISSRTSVWFFFIVSVSLVKYSFFSFLSSLNCPSEFSCVLLTFFMTAILILCHLNQPSITLSLTSGDLSFSFCVTMLPGSFMVLGGLFFCLHF
ncbi:hypothetical protein mRhiFer1_010281 [Rhinolophus ferrumequinum]|uniref:Uncharacterized protein n=1 Tax=Rhinolophus ferrumequinum TaxID=59479 RepID=A0A7J7X5G1_RHIFE|nr:hypothetical protein mRhiFer1_010281 [Rhinolophus ferrumequinum]